MLTPGFCAKKSWFQRSGASGMDDSNSDGWRARLRNTALHCLLIALNCVNTCVGGGPLFFPPKLLIMRSRSISCSLFCGVLLTFLNTPPSLPHPCHHPFLFFCRLNAYPGVLTCHILSITETCS